MQNQKSNKPAGNFSRRHKDAGPHMAAKARNLAELAAHFERRDRLATERAARTPQEQLAELDARLGRGQGAIRERARLTGIIARVEAKRAERKARRMAK